ncbi:MAG: hypothetical protein ACYDAA_14810 [Syntrophales bacterium]
MKRNKTGRPIKLFMFIHDLAPFGVQRVALQTVKNIDKRLFHVTVCSFGGAGNSGSGAIGSKNTGGRFPV